MMEAPFVVLPDHMPEYSFRPSILDEERRFRLEGDVLSIFTPKQGEHRIPLAAVREVYLTFKQSKQRTYYGCRLTLSDRSTISLQHQHFAGIGSFEDRRASYVPFVVALHRALAPFRGKVRFHTGSMLGMIGAVFGTVFFAAMVWFFVQWSSWLGIGMGAVGVLYCLSSISRSKPREYDPEALPPAFLPPVR